MMPPLTPKCVPKAPSLVPANMPSGVTAELQKPKITGVPCDPVDHQSNVSVRRTVAPASVNAIPEQVSSLTNGVNVQTSVQPTTWVAGPHVEVSSLTGNSVASVFPPAAGLAQIGDRSFGSIVTACNRSGTTTANTRVTAPNLPKPLPWQSELKPVNELPAPVTKNDAPTKFIADLVAQAIPSLETNVPRTTSRMTVPVMKDSPFVDVEVVTDVATQEQPDATPLASGNTLTTLATESVPNSVQPMVDEVNSSPVKSSTSDDACLDYPRIVNGQLPTGVSLEARAAMLAADAQDELQCFIASTNNAVRLRQDGKKILFEVSLQEFPRKTDLDLLKRYYYGKAYRRACIEVANSEYNFKAHLPFIREHEGSCKFLVCELTQRTLPLDSTVVENHVNSKRYLRLKEEAEKRIAEQKRVLEKKRKIAVGERYAKVEAREKDVMEETMLVEGYNSADDSDFDVDMEKTKEGEVEGDEDDGDSDADVVDPLQQDIIRGKVRPVAEPRAVLGKTGPERKSKTRAADMKHRVSDIPGYESEEDSDFEPTGEDDGDIEMEPDAFRIADPLMKPAGRAPVKHKKRDNPLRLSKTRAIAEVAKEAPKLEDSESSDDEMFVPNMKDAEDTDVGEDMEDVPNTSVRKNVSKIRKQQPNAIDQNEVEFVEVEIIPAKMTTPVKSDSSEGNTNMKDVGIVEQKNQEEYYVYKTVPKTPPRRPQDGHLGEVREKLRKKRVYKKAIRKAMKKAAEERRIIAKAKRELLLEQERVEERGFWTRGKHDVDLEEIREKVFGNDGTDAEWKTRKPRAVAGVRRKRAPQMPKKSRQDRLRRVMPGSLVIAKPEAGN